MFASVIFFLVVDLYVSYGETIILESFANPVHAWLSNNDPVMGGQSGSTFKIQNGIGIFDGEVRDVTFLNAPGFITMRAADSVVFPDVTSCSHLQLNVRTNLLYSGYRVSFGTARAPDASRFTRGYKARFDVPVSDNFVSVNISFTKFSNYWDPATGDLVKTCQENKIYCPDKITLQNMLTISIWGEGVNGAVNLEIKNIAAVGCGDVNEEKSGNSPSPREETFINPWVESDGTVLLESFGSPVHQWYPMNDPVMGGLSTGTFTIQGGIGLFIGQVVDVPSLSAPGFITTRTFDSSSFSDVSSCSHLQLNVRTNSSYLGYYVSFGTAQATEAMRHARGYKAHFDVPVGDDFISVNIPFTYFSNYWDAATGRTIKTCQENKKYCPDSSTLQDMKTIALWGEGVGGIVNLQVKSIAAIGCDNIFVESFSKPRHQWYPMNDPVMGGLSTGTFTIQNGIGIFIGQVVDVPSLSAPGFITTRTFGSSSFSDVSSCSHLQLNVRTNSSYLGYYISFGTAQATEAMRYASGYKAHFDVPVGDDFISVNIPFTYFSNYWNGATGRTVKTCQENKQYCPDSSTLKDMKTISLWGEGVGGIVNLQVKSIVAIGCRNDNKDTKPVPNSGETADPDTADPDTEDIAIVLGVIAIVVVGLFIWRCRKNAKCCSKLKATFSVAPRDSRLLIV